MILFLLIIIIYSIFSGSIVYVDPTIVTPGNGNTPGTRNNVFDPKIPPPVFPLVDTPLSDSLLIQKGFHWDIYNNKIIDGGHASILTARSKYITIHHNWIENVNSDCNRAFSFEQWSSHIKLYKNYFKNLNKVSQLGGVTHSEVYYNVWDGIGNLGINRRPDFLDAIKFQSYSGDVKFNKVYNNLFYNISRNGILFYTDKDEVSGNEVFNNIVYDYFAHGIRYAYAYTGVINNNTIKNNIFFSENTDKSKDIYYRLAEYTIEEFNEISKDINQDIISGNIYANPKFKDLQNSNFTLLKDSIAINAGLENGRTTDFDGFPIIELPDIGPYEFRTKRKETGTIWPTENPILNTIIFIFTGIFFIFIIVTFLLVAFFLIKIVKKKGTTKDSTIGYTKNFAASGSAQSESELIEVDDIEIGN